MADILRKPIEVSNALADLELSWEPLLEAMLAGESARDACTPNDPQSAPGYFSYTFTTRILAERLIPSGWVRLDLDGLALLISPNQRVAVVVSTGDTGTGTTRDVRSKYPKGPAMKFAVEQNRQGELFPELVKKQEIHNWKTWMLLRRRSSDMLYSELSLPLEIGEDLRVVDWSRRIIFEPISLQPTIDDDEDGGDPIEIVIKPRS